MATGRKKAPAKKKINAQLWSVLLFSGGILILLMAIIEGSSAWSAMHDFVRGVFGLGVFLVPVILIYSAIMIATERTKAIAGKVIQGFILIALVSGALHIFFFGEAEFLDINDIAEFLYNNGVALKGGGFFSIFLGVPLVSFLGQVGATIVILLFVFVFVMLLTGITLMDFLGFFAKPFVKAKAAIKEASEEDAVMAKQRAAERQRKSAAKLPPNEPLPPEARKPKIENIDIPIPVEPKSQPVVENTPCENAVKEIAPKKPDLDAIIKKVVDTSAPAVQEKAETAEKPAIEENGQTRLYEKSEPVAEYKYPPISLLTPSKKSAAGANTQTELKQSADTLVNTLKSFGVQTRIVDIHRGPTVTRYELQPSAGVKISKITGLADDIALNLAAAGVRIEAPIPGKAAVGIEVPNKSVDVVTLREIIEAKEFDSAKSKVSFALGRDIAGNVIMADIAKMPHVLIAGSTGSGKSVCINSIIMSLLYKSSPEEVKLLMIDPKVVELGVYNGIPHLLIPVVTDPRKAAGALNWAVQEMLRRYKLFADNNVRDLTGYNELAAGKEDLDIQPQIVVIIDELADLMMAAPNEVEDSICRLAQMARAAGMHLVIATQRPSVDIITGVIKANIPSRIAFAVSSQIDSRTILDGAGAEKLLGRGDMLFYPSGMPKPTRVQGCFVTDKEVENVVGFIKNSIMAEYDDKIMKEIEENAPAIKGEKSDTSSSGGGVDSTDEMVEKAIEVVVEAGQASTSLLQRRLKLGYARAARIIDELEQMGVVGSFEGAKPRQVLISKEQWYERKLRAEISAAPAEISND